MPPRRRSSGSGAHISRAGSAALQPSPLPPHHRWPSPARPASASAHRLSLEPPPQRFSAAEPPRSAAFASASDAGAGLSRTSDHAAAGAEPEPLVAALRQELAELKQRLVETQALPSASLPPPPPPPPSTLDCSAFARSSGSPSAPNAAGARSHAACRLR